MRSDLIFADKDRLKGKAKADLRDAFPGGGQAMPLGDVGRRFENRAIADYAPTARGRPRAHR